MKRILKALFALSLAVMMPVMSVAPVLAYEKVIENETKELTEVEECVGTEYYINGTQVIGPMAIGTYLDESYTACDQQSASWKVIGDDSAENNKQVVSESTEFTGATETLVSIKYHYDAIEIGGEGERTPVEDIPQTRYYDRVEYYTKKTSYKIIVNIQVEAVTKVPEQPTEPDTPDTPDKPEEPVKPEEPTKPTEPTKPAENPKQVKTGMVSNMTLWISLAMMSLLSYFGLILLEKE